MSARTDIDFRRVGWGLKMPGIDTRSWISLARIDEDPDATVWDAELGWLCDVTFVGGALDGDGPNLARWGGRGLYRPPVQGSLCLCAVVSGDGNDDVVILGLLDTDPEPAPGSVNGEAVDEARASTTHLAAFPGQALDAEFETVRITGSMVLGVADADQSYVRGEDFADAAGDFIDALDQFLTAAPPPGPFGSVNSATFTAAASVLKLALQQFKLARNTYLSRVIKGT